MNKLKKSPLLKYLPIVLLFPIALNFILFSFDSGLAYGDGDTWLGFWGNYSGGVISAIVAYIVANTQIEKQMKIDLQQKKRDRLVAQLPSLIRIKFDLENYLEQLANTNQERDYRILAEGGLIITSDENGLVDYDENEDGILDFELVSQQFVVEPLDKEIYELIEKIENDELHIELITCLKFYENFSKALSYDPDQYDDKKDKLMEEVRSDKLDYTKYYNIVARDEKEVLDVLDKKIKYWDQYFEEDMNERFEALIKKVDSEIENVKQIKAE